MRRFINRKCIAAVFVAFALIAAVAGGLSFHNGAASTHKAHADGVGGKIGRHAAATRGHATTKNTMNVADE